MRADHVNAVDNMRVGQVVIGSGVKTVLHNVFDDLVDKRAYRRAVKLLDDASGEVGVGGLRGTSVEKVGEGGLRGGWGEEGCASASTAFSPGWASSLATASDDASRKVGALPGRGPRGLLPGALMPAAQGECRAFAALLGRERCGVHDSAPLGDCSGMMLARALR